MKLREHLITSCRKTFSKTHCIKTIETQWQKKNFTGSQPWWRVGKMLTYKVSYQQASQNKLHRSGGSGIFYTWYWKIKTAKNILFSKIITQIWRIKAFPQTTPREFINTITALQKNEEMTSSTWNEKEKVYKTLSRVTGKTETLTSEY